VDWTIHLDDQPGFNADEIDHERTERALPAELQPSQLAIPNCVPQDGFGGRLPQPKVSCRLGRWIRRMMPTLAQGSHL
jgi:hypothetical protein